MKIQVTHDQPKELAPPVLVAEAVIPTEPPNKPGTSQQTDTSSSQVLSPLQLGKCCDTCRAGDCALDRCMNEECEYEGRFHKRCNLEKRMWKAVGFCPRGGWPRAKLWLTMCQGCRNEELQFCKLCWVCSRTITDGNLCDFVACAVCGHLIHKGGSTMGCVMGSDFIQGGFTCLKCYKM